MIAQTTAGLPRDAPTPVSPWSVSISTNTESLLTLVPRSVRCCRSSGMGSERGIARISVIFMRGFSLLPLKIWHANERNGLTGVFNRLPPVPPGRWRRLHEGHSGHREAPFELLDAFCLTVFLAKCICDLQEIWRQTFSYLCLNLFRDTCRRLRQCRRLYRRVCHCRHPER